MQHAVYYRKCYETLCNAAPLVHARQDDNEEKDAEKELDKMAIEWQVQRGSRSGRVAKQFVMSLLAKG